MVVGDGLQQGTQMGPLQNKQQFEKVLGFIDSARADGKVIAAGPMSTMLASEHPWLKAYFRGKRGRVGATM